MTPESFSAILAERIRKIRRTLRAKAGEYSNGHDVMHNFRRAAAMQGTTAEQALVGMWAKHVVSVMDMVVADPRVAGLTRR